MRRLVWALAVLALFAPVVANAQLMRDPSIREVSVTPLPAGVAARPIALTRLKSDIREDQSVGMLMAGVVCLPTESLTFSYVARQMDNLAEIFAQELQTTGFRSATDPGSLFSEANAASSDLQAGAVLKSMKGTYCANIAGRSGKLAMVIEWQVYSNLRRETVATIMTREGAQGRMSERNPRTLPQEAFAANVRALISDEGFRRAVLESQSGAGAAAPQGVLTLASTSAATPISDAPGAVVGIFVGSGFGSGVLVSTDGHILTNQHVVGDASEVRVRWSDGLERTGQVLRSDKRRDVALLKVEPRNGRQPLGLRRIALAPGTPVFAIGMPLDEKLQGTMTRGIVSANRVIDGFSFIQSDVAVTNGNSGGPLLDEQGRVVGLTVSGFRPTGEANSLNYFIPIGDALDFLSLKTTP